MNNSLVESKSQEETKREDMNILEQEIREGSHKLNTMKNTRMQMLSRNKVLRALIEAQESK